MDYWKNKVALITGACYGIGGQIAEDLVRSGMIVIGLDCTNENVSKMFDNLEKWGVVDGQLIPCKCDVSNDEELKLAFDGIVTAYGGIDLFINNAAIGREGLISTSNPCDMKKVIDVNIFGMISCTRYAVESMRKKNDSGQIININSICGHYMPGFPKPTVNLYIASKKTMTVFNKLLKNELKTLNSNIRVSSVSPGLVRTGIFKAAGLKILDDEYFDKHPYLTVKDVSNIVIMILSAPRGVQINDILFHTLHEIY